MKIDEWIPAHATGVQTNTEYSVTCASDEEALHHLERARKRLLHINGWHRIAGAASADFHLVDSAGNQTDRPAQKGDYFRIDIPGPGSHAGRGYDWVRIEAIEEAADGTALRVRPAVPPNSERSEVGHFFSERSTSSFIVWRDGLTIAAGIYGRNESPNTDVHALSDKIRNAAIAVSAFFGLSKLEWKSLAKGLIEDH